MAATPPSRAAILLATGGFVLERGALVDGENARFAVFRLPTALNAKSFDLGHFFRILFCVVTVVTI